MIDDPNNELDEDQMEQGEAEELGMAGQPDGKRSPGATIQGSGDRNPGTTIQGSGDR